MALKDKKRKTIQKKNRAYIFERDKYICGYCGKKDISINLAVDHIIPVNYGGYHGEDNWVTSCKKCNREKWLYAPNEKNSPRLILHAGKSVVRCSWMAKGKRFPARIPRISYKKI